MTPRDLQFVLYKLFVTAPESIIEWSLFKSIGALTCTAADENLAFSVSYMSWKNRDFCPVWLEIFHICRASKIISM